MEQWHFYQDRHGEWSWRHVDRHGCLVKASDATFGSREACMSDASSRGYRLDPRPWNDEGV
jgi:hypothetical protein